MRPPTGRRLDVVNTPDGRRVPGESFPYLLKVFASLKRYQIVQDATNHCEVRLVVNDSWNDQHRRKIEEGVRLALGPTMRFEVVLTEDIPLTATGKLRVVINRTTPPAGASHRAASPVPLAV